MKMKKQISYPLLYFLLMLNIFIALLLGPIYPVFIGILVSIIAFFVLLKKGKVKEYQKGDIFKIFGITLSYIFVFMILGLVSFMNVSWWKLIIIGATIDLFAFINPFRFPIIEGIISGIVAIILCISFIGGFWGLILGAVAGLIAMIPFIENIPVFTLMSFVIIKLISIIIYNIIGGIV